MSRATLHCGDVREVLALLPEASVQCVVTSPPYWGLRDYGTAKWEGGSVDCDHKQNHGVQGATGQRADRTFTAQAVYREECRKCGGRRVDRQLGLEPTPGEYVANMVAVFQAVHRVLREDGVLWLNLGDSYAGYWGEKYAHKPFGLDRTPDASTPPHKPTPPWKAMGLKPKDLVGIPWRVAFALQENGWWLRSDVIWAKPNPMPESVTDRPTRSHEYLFLLTKSERYYYDAAAIAEEVVSTEVDLRRARVIGRGQQSSSLAFPGAPKQDKSGGFPVRDISDPTRNARSVWTIATQPYPQAHFATFPEELARRCILAGSKPGDTVLDPFGGSGTVAQVATGNGRNAIYIDLNPEYLELARQRIGPMLCEGVA